VRERIANLRALRLRAAGDAQGAAAVLREAIVLDPGVVELHFNLGQISSDVGAWEDAERAFARVIGRHPAEYATSPTSGSCRASSAPAHGWSPLGREG